MQSDDEEYVVWAENSPMNFRRVQRRQRQRTPNENRAIRDDRHPSPNNPANLNSRNSSRSDPEQLLKNICELEAVASSYTKNDSQAASDQEYAWVEEPFECDFTPTTTTSSTQPTQSSSVINFDAVFGPEDIHLEQQLKAIDEHEPLRSNTIEIRPSVRTVPVCTAEDIERKRREAVARRKVKQWERNRAETELRQNINQYRRQHDTNNNSRNNDTASVSFSCSPQSNGSSSSSNSLSSSNGDDNTSFGNARAATTLIPGMPNVSLLSNLRSFPKR